MQTTSAVELDGSGLPLESLGFLASTSTAEILPWPIVPQPPTETIMGHHAGQSHVIVKISSKGVETLVRGGWLRSWGPSQSAATEHQSE